MAKRITITNFTGIKSGQNNLYINLTPNADANSLESLTKVVVRKQKGGSNITNLGKIVDITLTSQAG